MTDHERRLNEVEDRVFRLDETVRGNGKDGLVTRIASLEAKVTWNTRGTLAVIAALVANIIF